MPDHLKLRKRLHSVQQAQPLNSRFHCGEINKNNMMQVPQGEPKVFSVSQKFVERVLGTREVPGIERFVERLGAIPIRDWVFLALVVAVVVFPLIFLRGYHYEEGLTAALAKDSISGGRWYLPELFGYRWMERPVLLSWIVAVLSYPLGEVYQLVVRIPIAVSLFLGALLVVVLLRPRVPRAIALLATLFFIFNPVVIAKVVTAESDIALSTVQFAAFVLWWRQYEKGRFSFLASIGVGILLGATALFKGPQPAAFFAFGIGAFILTTRSWSQVPGFILSGIISLAILGTWFLFTFEQQDANTMLTYMRMAILPGFTDYVLERGYFIGKTALQFGPGGFIVIAVTYLSIRGKISKPSERDSDLILALSLYAGVALFFLTFWPGARIRYAMPAVLPVVCIAALCYGELIERSVQLVRVALTFLIGVMIYQFLWGWVIAPVASEQFDKSRIAARTLQSVTSAKPHVIYAPLRLDDAVLAYMNRPVKYLTLDQFYKVESPAFLLMPGHVAEQFRQTRAGEKLVLLGTLINRNNVGIYEMNQVIDP